MGHESVLHPSESLSPLLEYTKFSFNIYPLSLCFHWFQKNIPRKTDPYYYQNGSVIQSNFRTFFCNLKAPRRSAPLLLPPEFPLECSEGCTRNLYTRDARLLCFSEGSTPLPQESLYPACNKHSLIHKNHIHKTGCSGQMLKRMCSALFTAKLRYAFPPLFCLLIHMRIIMCLFFQCIPERLGIQPGFTYSAVSRILSSFLAAFQEFSFVSSPASSNSSFRCAFQSNCFYRSNNHLNHILRGSIVCKLLHMKSVLLKRHANIVGSACPGSLKNSCYNRHHQKSSQQSHPC